MGSSRSWSLFLLIAVVLALLVPGVADARDASPPGVDAQLQAAPLNPEFVAYQQDLADGRLSHGAGGSTLGLRPAPFDVSYLEGLAVPGTAGAYPAKYDLRTLNRVTSAKDQGPNGTCWVFATMSSLESCLLLPPAGTAYDFSEDNCVLTHGFDYVADGPYATGGFYQESTAYLARWGGPVYESEDPYFDNVTPAGLTPKKHVQRVLWLPGRGYLPGVSEGWTAIAKDAVKAAVTSYGGVWSTIHVGDATDQTAYFNDATDAWYYNGTGNTDHAVLIAGWDDAYPATNFAAAHRPPGNGAWIVKNSWGTGWGANGFFYVSYYDTRFGDCLACFNNAEATTNYKSIYQYDKLGVCQSVGFGVSPTGWFANTFTASSSDSLAAVSFYAMAPGTAYEIWAGPTLAGKAKKASGTVQYAGYYTVKLPTPMPLTNGTKFSVAVKATLPAGTKYPIPIEAPIANYSSAASAAAGQSFVSGDGASWLDLTAQGADYAKANVCLKAFTSAALTTTRYQETDAKLSYSTAWTPVTNASCSGGTMRTRAAAGSVTANFTGTAVSIVATKGAAYGKMKVTLDGNTAAATTVTLTAATTAYQQKVYTKAGLANAAHTLKIEWVSGTANLDALDVTGTLTQAPLPTVRYQESDARLLYSPAWTSVTNASCSGGYMRTRAASGSVTALFKGTGISVVATKGAAYGQMKVTVDGAATTVTLSAATTAYQQKVYTKAGLANAAHTLRIDWVSGTANLDALDVQGALTALATTTYQETDTKIVYTPAWTTSATNAVYSGGTMRYRNSAGSATASFTGTGVVLLATKGPAYGKLKVFLDNTAPVTVDLYRATSNAYQQAVYTKTGLTYGGHLLRLEWTGTKNTAATATTVNIDALRVTGTLTQAPTRYEENNTKIAWAPAFTNVPSGLYSGSAMRKWAASGAVTASFTGTLVNVVATKGTSYGKLKITLDGTATTVDLYAAATAYHQRVYTKSGLANVAHTLKLEWTNTKATAASATTVNLDAVEIIGTLNQAATTTAYQENDAKLRYLGAWSRVAVAGTSGGYQKQINAAGAIFINFTGPAVNLISTKGPAYGRMQVTVDPLTLDQPPTTTVDLYAGATAVQQKVYTKSGLTNAPHQLLIEWTGGRNAAATGTTVNLDAFEIPGGTLTQAPDFTGGLNAGRTVGYWAATPEPNWVESWKFWANGTYNYFVSNGYTWYQEEGLYVAYQGATSKAVIIFDRRYQDGPELPWQYGLTAMECPYWITYYSDGTLLKINGPNLDVNYWLQP